MRVTNWGKHLRRAVFRRTCGFTLISINDAGARLAVFDLAKNGAGMRDEMHIFLTPEECRSLAQMISRFTS